MILHRCMIATGLAFASSIAVAKNCEDGASNMTQVRACRGDDLEKSLSRKFAMTLDHVRSRDEEAARLLQSAQDSWRRFAEASCAYTVKARQMDVLANDARANCWAAFINNLALLKQY